MDTFHKVVIFVSIFVLFSMLISVAMLLDNSTGGTVYPPSALTCPDYWTETDEGCKPGTINKGNIESTAPIDFSTGGGGWDDNLTGSQTCKKRSWANNNDVLWDGISNYNGC